VKVAKPTNINKVKMCVKIKARDVTFIGTTTSKGGILDEIYIPVWHQFDS
jgi:hypothetical protein